MEPCMSSPQPYLAATLVSKPLTVGVGGRDLIGLVAHASIQSFCIMNRSEDDRLIK